MSQTIRAIYHNGLIEPLEKLNLTENTEITVKVSLLTDLGRPLAKEAIDEVWNEKEHLPKRRFSLQGIIKGGNPIPEAVIDEVIKEWERE
jgi:predicted DNA-binding antitoxin AbrB/MazE fold protein